MYARLLDQHMGGTAMIHPDCKYLDIYPYTWRHLGELMEYLNPRRKILYILHDQGIISKAADSDNTTCTLPFSKYQAEEFPSCRLFELYPDIDEIHVLEYAALVRYYTSVQSISLEEKNTMQYLDFITDYYSCHKGIDIYSRRKCSGTFYRKALDYAGKFLNDRQIVFFVVTKSEFIWFDVVLLVENGTITEIRTLDTLKSEAWYTSPCTALSEAAQKLAEKFSRPVKIIHYEHEALPLLTAFWEKYCV